MEEAQFIGYEMDRDQVRAFRAEHPNPVFESSADEDGKVRLYYHDNPRTSRLPEGRELREALDEAEVEEAEMTHEVPEPEEAEEEASEAEETEESEEEEEEEAEEAAPSSQREALADKTKAELMEMAQDMDLKGRSSMNKGELLDAILEAK